MKHISFKFLLIILSGCAFAADEWPQYMGPNRDGTVVAPGLFDGEVALERIWTQPLGSGFSGIAVGGGKLYTMHSAGKMDALSCFDAATGRKLWSFDYGVSFPQVGGSEPGPLSTPVLDGNRVYGLGARGELFCLEASSGKRVWARDMVKELGAVQPWCGFTTSPLVSDGFLILNAGDNKDKGIAAFNKNTGVLAWHLGAEGISFQSPSLVTLMGRKQVVSLSESKIRGIDPATGEVIWEKDGKSWIQMITIGDDLMLFGHAPGFTLQRIGDAGVLNLTEIGNSLAFGGDAGEIKVIEKWSSLILNLEYDMPVHHKGYLYGFNGFYAHCLKLETGELVWSSGDAGRGMAILVDGHLAILSSDGSFRVARAWQKGYEERASIKVFEKSGITVPSYADRVFYMRNYTNLAAVRVK